jgi:hypothetical protein
MSASGDDGRKLFQCGAERARIQGPRCNETVRPLSRGKQRPNLPYKKALRDIFGGIHSTSIFSGNSVTSLLESSLLNIDISLTVQLHFMCIYSDPAVTTHTQLFKHHRVLFNS